MLKPLRGSPSSPCRAGTLASPPPIINHHELPLTMICHSPWLTMHHRQCITHQASLTITHHSPRVTTTNHESPRITTTHNSPRLTTTHYDSPQLTATQHDLWLSMTHHSPWLTTHHDSPLWRSCGQVWSCSESVSRQFSERICHKTWQSRVKTFLYGFRLKTLILGQDIEEHTRFQNTCKCRWLANNVTIPESGN